jgi:gluconate 2-dehydrogenase gamma chain
MKQNISRRTVLAGAAALVSNPAALIPVSAIQAAPAPPPTALNAASRGTLDAVLARLIPKDDLGPGAVELGAGDYIDRSLAGFLADEKTAFLNGLEALEAHARSSNGMAFAQLGPEQQDAILISIEDKNFPPLKPFFTRLQRLTLEGSFGDPSYGGNRGLAGWDLIRYPGVRLAVSPDDQKMDHPPASSHHSAYGEASHGH